jgi:membrane-associated phospholipid phosphatase
VTPPSTPARFASWRRSADWTAARRLAPAVLAALVLVAALTVLVGRSVSKPSALDRHVAVWFAGHRAGWLTPVMRIITTLGSPTGIMITATVLVGALCWRSRRFWPGLLAVVVLGGAELLQTTTKVLVARPRPPMSLWAPGLSATGFSFPSGHAVVAGAGYGLMAILLTRYTGRRLRVAATAAAAVVGVSRLYLGVHWFTDVLAGWVIGALWLSLVLGVTTFYARSASSPQNALAADFHSWRRCAMSSARSFALPPSSIRRSEGSARR